MGTRSGPKRNWVSPTSAERLPVSLDAVRAVSVAKRLVNTGGAFSESGVIHSKQIRGAFLVAACQQKRRVRFATATGLINELVKAQHQHMLGRALKRWSKYDVVAIDEVGYVPIAEIGAEYLFQVIADRAEKAAVILRTNLPFSEWTKVIPNARLCKELIDRITVQAHIIEAGHDSYRFKRYAPGGHGRLSEARPWLLGVPREELIEAQVVNMFRDWRGDGIERGAREGRGHTARGTWIGLQLEQTSGNRLWYEWKVNLLHEPESRHAGVEFLKRTRAFSRRQSAPLSTTANSFI